MPENVQTCSQLPHGCEEKIEMFLQIQNLKASEDKEKVWINYLVPRKNNNYSTNNNIMRQHNQLIFLFPWEIQQSCKHGIFTSQGWNACFLKHNTVLTEPISDNRTTLLTRHKNLCIIYNPKFSAMATPPGSCPNLNIPADEKGNCDQATQSWTSFLGPMFFEKPSTASWSQPWIKST